MGYPEWLKKRFKNGLEIGNPEPMEIPVGYKQPMTLQEMLGRLREVDRLQAQAGLETLDDAEDFDIEDDPMDPSTAWEENFDLFI